MPQRLPATRTISCMLRRQKPYGGLRLISNRGGNWRRYAAATSWRAIEGRCCYGSIIHIWMQPFFTMCVFVCESFKLAYRKHGMHILHVSSVVEACNTGFVVSIRGFLPLSLSIQAVKCLEAVCQSPVPFLPLVEIRTRMALARVLLRHSTNVTRAKEHMDRVVREEGEEEGREGVSEGEGVRGSEREGERRSNNLDQQYLLFLVE